MEATLPPIRIWSCPKCGHNQVSRVVEKKRYYACSCCKYQYKLPLEG